MAVSRVARSLHLLGATLSVGGQLVLALSVPLRALADRRVAMATPRIGGRRHVPIRLRRTSSIRCGDS